MTYLEFAAAIRAIDNNVVRQDSDYRALLSTMSKRQLKRGETWRQVALFRLGVMTLHETN
jgi:hypothetical protein